MIILSSVLAGVLIFSLAVLVMFKEDLFDNSDKFVQMVLDLEIVDNSSSAPDRVDIAVVHLKADDHGNVMQMSPQLVATAVLRKGIVFIRVFDGDKFINEVINEIESDQMLDPIGFMNELMVRFPDNTYGAACGSPFAVPYYREAA